MASVTEFFNPNHDARGRFASGPSGGGKFAYSKSSGLMAIQKLLMTASNLRKNLRPDEKTALEDYTQTFDGAGAINQALLGKAKRPIEQGGKLFTSKSQRQTTLQSIHAIESVFDKTPLNPVPLQLMRGIGKVGGEWGKPGSLTGRVLSTDAISSTTSEVSYAAYAAKTTAGRVGGRGDSVLMVINAPEKTVRALPVSDVLHGDRKGLRPKPLHEVMLPPGTQVVVQKDEPAPANFLPGGKTFDRIVTVEVLPENPDYRQPLSFRDGTNFSALMETVSLFYNPNHDARGRFTSGPGGIRLSGKFKKAGPPKSAAEKELDDLIKGIRKKNDELKHLKNIHEHYTTVGKTSAETQLAVRFYEGDFQRCGAMNDILRHGEVRPKNSEVLEFTPEKTIRAHVENLKAEFGRAPTLAKDTVVHRAVRNMPGGTDPKRIAAMEKERQLAQDRFDFTGISYWDDQISAARRGGDMTGKVLKDEGFMSTTADAKTATGYLNYSGPGDKPAMLKLTAPKGTPVVAVNSIIGKEGGPQAELLLPPGTSYRVTGDTTENGMRVITGEIIPVSRETFLSGRDLLPIVSLFFNPNHDARGRFASSPGGGARKIMGPSNAEKIKNAATMFGYGSPQHKKALKLFSPGKVTVGGKAVHALEKHSPDAKRAAALRAKGLATPDLVELDPKEGAAGFRAAMEGLKQNNRFAASVYVYDEAEYRDMRLFTSDDGKTGFALHGDEVVSVFTYRDSKYRGATQSNLSVAVEQGARRLDAFDTVLPAIYQEAGFEPVARVKWDDDYAPDGWDYGTFGKFNGGRPDVVFMAYNKAKEGTSYQPGTGRYVKSYDEGLAAAKDAVK